MMEYKRVPTSESVWLAVKSQHANLKVFSSYSAPQGDYFGNPDVCRMLTEYGFENCDYPTIGAETTWDRNSHEPIKRENEQHKYWLCIGIKEIE